MVNARNEGLAALERARGEGAALRSLANADRLLENNPELYRLRVLRALDSIKGNTIVLAPGLEEVLPAAKPGKGKKIIFWGVVIDETAACCRFIDNKNLLKNRQAEKTWSSTV